MGFFGGQAPAPTPVPQPPKPVVVEPPPVKVETPVQPQPVTTTYKVANVLDYGADRTGSTDSSDAFNKALIDKNHVFMPEGVYRIDKSVFIRHSGTRLYGSGRHNTILIITTKTVENFGTETDGGVFMVMCDAPGPHISDFMIRFDNDLNPKDRASLLKNRPAINFYGKNGDGVARGMIEKLAIYRAYDGIKLTGNCGGVTIEDVECSSLNIGLHIEGDIYDSVKVTRWHQWVFDYGVMHGEIGDDSKGFAIKVHRCDDLHVSDSLFFKEGVYLRDGFGSFTNCDFDALSALTIKGEEFSTWAFSSCYFSNQGHMKQQQIIIENLNDSKSNASEVNFVGCSFSTTDLYSIGSPLMSIKGNIKFDDVLSVNFAGCNFKWHDNPVNELTNPLILADNAFFTISASRFMPLYRGVKINTPIIRGINSSRGAISGCTAFDWGANPRKVVSSESGSIIETSGCVFPGYA